MSPGTLTIAVVDDAVDVRVLVKTRLRRSGRFEVVGEGADGAEAVSLAREHRPDLMLLDVSMPGVDGLEALPGVLEASPTTRVVLFSGFEEQGLADRALELGASAFIEKSASVEELVGRLVKVGSSASTTTEAPPRPTEPDLEGVGDRTVLDEHRERFREVFEEAAIGMATMTLTGRLIRGNRALASLVRLPTEELVGTLYAGLTDGAGEAVTEALDRKSVV